MVKKPNKPLSLTGPRPQPGGFYAPTTHTIVTRVDGSTVAQTQVNFGEVELPDRSYSADSGGIARHAEDDFLTLVFCQRGYVDRKPRSLVGVKLYPDAVRNFVKACTDIQPTIAKFIERTHIVLPDLSVPKEEPAQSVLLVGSAILAAYSGREAELSVYHLSPMRLHRAKGTSMVAIDPVVRIELPTGLMVAMINRLGEIVPSLPLTEDRTDA